MIRFSREITLGVTLEIEGRLVRSTVEQGRRSGEGQDSRIARAGSLRLFGQLQKPVGPCRIGESLTEHIDPDFRIGRQLVEL